MFVDCGEGLIVVLMNVIFQRKTDDPLASSSGVTGCDSAAPWRPANISRVVFGQRVHSVHVGITWRKIVSVYRLASWTVYGVFAFLGEASIRMTNSRHNYIRVPNVSIVITSRLQAAASSAHLLLATASSTSWRLAAIHSGESECDARQSVVCQLIKQRMRRDKRCARLPTACCMHIVNFELKFHIFTITSKQNQYDIWNMNIMYHVVGVLLKCFMFCDPRWCSIPQHTTHTYTAHT